MAQRSDLTVIEGNTVTVTATIKADDTGLPQDLTGLTVEYLVKANATIPDIDPSVVKLSTSTGEITITDAAAGKCSIDLPAQAAGTLWRRLDVVSGGSRKTALYGDLIVVGV